MTPSVRHRAIKVHYYYYYYYYYLIIKILRNYIPTQFKFQLGIYDISFTWIELYLDTQIMNAVRYWIELPISLFSLAYHKSSWPWHSLNERNRRITSRHKQHLSNNPLSVAIWKTTSTKNTNVDSIILENNDRQTTMRCLKNIQNQRSANHITTLVIQGRILLSY